MIEIISLSCPNCGGKLEITNDIEQFACGYCGHEHIVSRKGGIISIKPVTEGLEKIQRGTDKTAAELGIVRLEKEMSEIINILDNLETEKKLNGGKIENSKLYGTILGVLFLIILFTAGFSIGLLLFFVVLLAIQYLSFLEASRKFSLKDNKILELIQKKSEMQNQLAKNRKLANQ